MWISRNEIGDGFFKFSGVFIAPSTPRARHPSEKDPLIRFILPFATIVQYDPSLQAASQPPGREESEMKELRRLLTPSPELFTVPMYHILLYSFVLF